MRRLKAFVERIEDGKTAVLLIQGGGECFIPKRQFGFPIHEGMHLTIILREDSQSEAKTRKRVISLQERLLKRSRR